MAPRYVHSISSLDPGYVSLLVSGMTAAISLEKVSADNRNGHKVLIKAAFCKQFNIKTNKNEQCVVYKYDCPVCETGYVGYTTQHLFQCIDEHQLPNSAISRHLQSTHNTNSKKIQRNFSVLKKCHGKLDCLTHEMLYIKQLKHSLNNPTL